MHRGRRSHMHAWGSTYMRKGQGEAGHACVGVGERRGVVRVCVGDGGTWGEHGEDWVPHGQDRA